LLLNTGSTTAKLGVTIVFFDNFYGTNAYRRQRLAKKLMDDLEHITEKVHKAYFVDLFVRVSNASAIRMYNKVSRQRAPSAISMAFLHSHEPCVVAMLCNVDEHPAMYAVLLQFGYSIYRTVLGYYSGDENAYDMRKAMSRDKEGKSVIPLTRPIHPHELEHD